MGVVPFLPVSMDSSPPRKVPQGQSAAGVKRAALLPPFEPCSSPPLPRPAKRRVLKGEDSFSTYPTPVPTSSTAILSSSPSRIPPALQRTQSVTSERAPLSDVPCVMLEEDGEPITMGRSSASCSYQLSPNRLISRVHVKAYFKPASHPFDRDKIEILCMGWNGIKLHCQGKTYELAKGKTFTSDIRDADVMIDVQDSRVLVQWPRPERKDSNSEHTWDESSPIRNADSRSRHGYSESPLKSRERLLSPVSPSPAVQALGSADPLTSSRSVPNAVVVYEDEPSPVRPKKSTTDPKSTSQSTERASISSDANARNSISSNLTKSDELSEHDEENDPIVFSFGPYGENLLPRMAAVNARDTPTASPHQKPLKRSASARESSSTKESTDSYRSAIQNHIINQLAFSRLSSTPFSTIVSNLPSDLVGTGSSKKPKVSNTFIRSIIEDTRCIGTVNRKGKDAAGKQLECEYYYTPDLDTDEMRKQAVVNELRKPGLRNCRKQHKVIHSMPRSIIDIFLTLSSNTSGNGPRPHKSCLHCIPA